MQVPRVLFALMTFLVVSGRIGVGDDRDGNQQREPVKAGYVQASADRAIAETMRQAGLNAAWVKWTRFRPDGDDPTAWRRMEQWIVACQRQRLQLWPVVNFLGRDEELAFFPNFRREVSGQGVVQNHTPCPVDEAYWRAVIFPRILKIAERSKTAPSLAGVVLDLELYGADHSAYAWPCACESCQQGVGSSKPQALFDWQRREVTRIARDLERRVHEIAPAFQLAAMHMEEPFPFYEGLALGLGTKEIPVVVAAERTYSTGATPEMVAHRDRLRALQAHTSFVGGLQLNLFTADQVAPQLYSLGTQGDGFWIYTLGSLAAPRDQVPAAYRLPEAHERYWSAFRRASEELSRWKDSGGRYVSPLVAERKPAEPRFTMTRRVLEPVTSQLPQRLPQGTESRWRRFNLFYVLLEKDEKLTIEASTKKSSQQDLDVQIKLVEPDGRELWTRAIKLGTKERFEWQAPAAATYLVAVMSGLNECQLTIENPRVIVLASRHQRAKFIGSVRPLFFQVHEGQRPSVEVFVEAANESVRVRLFDARGKLVAEERVTGSQTISAEGAPGIWSMSIEPVGRMSFGGVQLSLAPPLSPYLADAPERLLKDRP